MCLYCPNRNYYAEHRDFKNASLKWNIISVPYEGTVDNNMLFIVSMNEEIDTMFDTYESANLYVEKQYNEEILRYLDELKINVCRYSESCSYVNNTEIDEYQ